MRISSHKIRHGFTIIELLVVVTIIIALIAILLPAMGVFRKQGNKAAAYSAMANIRDGLASYYADFNMYPPSAPGALGTSGSAMVAEALLGYLPGAKDGAGTGNPTNDSSNFGFRTKIVNPAMGGAAGKVYGPYANTDPKVFNGTAFIDPWGLMGNQILYYRSTKAQSPTTMNSVKTIFGSGAASDDTATYFFNSSDCSTVTIAATPSTATPPTGTNSFFSLIAGTSNNVAGPVMGSTSYILISAGPDETYFTADDIVMSK